MANFCYARDDTVNVVLKKGACALWFHLSSEHFDLISVVCKSVYHENVFLFFKQREKGHDIYVFVQQLSTPQK